MSVAIRIENLGKQYRLGEVNQKMLYLELQSWWAKVRGKEDPNSLVTASGRSTQKGDFWALKNISFEVNEGDVVGVIGKNGSGKSTLLKILSEVTSPTEGCASIKGTVASLLEVGTGFHNELTGRENVYLNGSILGMSRKQIDSRYNDIVEFAGVEEFMDTPVKRYSSGMKLRLAFAVAAHLDPEVLILDEVLAVGDVAFQQKCLGRIGEVAQSGRTILFVSHNMAAVQSLCNKGVVLNEGRLVFAGDVDAAIDHYLQGQETEEQGLGHRSDRKGNGRARVTKVELRTLEGRSVDTLRTGQTIDVCLEVENNTGEPLRNLHVDFSVKNQFDVPIFKQHNNHMMLDWPELTGKRATVRCRLFEIPMVESSFRMDVRLREDRFGEILDQLDHVLDFHVVASDHFGSGELPKNKNFACVVRGDWFLENK